LGRGPILTIMTQENFASEMRQALVTIASGCCQDW
jgi:hypothetical protein